MRHPRRVSAIGNGCVIPAQAEIHFDFNGQWIPAFAEMTAVRVGMTAEA